MTEINHQKGHAPVNGAQLYYEVAGSGTPLLLLHAGIADSRMWDDQFLHFARDYKVVRFDYRGFGGSPMPPGQFANHDDVAGLLDYLQIPAAVLVGISFGGKIALDFALAYPQRVRALVLGAPSVGGDTPSDRIKQFWADEDAALEKDDLDAATEINLRLWVDGPSRTPDQINPVVRRRVGEMQRHAFTIPIPDDVEEVTLTPAAVSRLDEIVAPTIILVGDLDLPEKVALAQRLATEMTNAQLVTMANVAHMLNMEAPELFNRHVLNFLQNHVGSIQ